MIKVKAQDNAANMLMERSIMARIRKNVYYVLDGDVWMIDGETNEVYRADQEESETLKEMIYKLQTVQRQLLESDEMLSTLYHETISHGEKCPARSSGPCLCKRNEIAELLQDHGRTI